ncbi:unnamed protein product [Durusdinium trenchii]|uniref:Uncharacterized protein n=1 Tax=Durusdinium trenchii TaxID=1381693 RepID=A0ABP0KH70_9DINO
MADGPMVEVPVAAAAAMPLEAGAEAVPLEEAHPAQGLTKNDIGEREAEVLELAKNWRGVSLERYLSEIKSGLKTIRRDVFYAGGIAIAKSKEFLRRRRRFPCPASPRQRVQRCCLPPG